MQHSPQWRKGSTRAAWSFSKACQGMAAALRPLSASSFSSPLSGTWRVPWLFSCHSLAKQQGCRGLVRLETSAQLAIFF